MTAEYYEDKCPPKYDDKCPLCGRKLKSIQPLNGGITLCSKCWEDNGFGDCWEDAVFHDGRD
jgi:hypothetical protein